MTAEDADAVREAVETTLSALHSAGILLGIVSTAAPQRLHAILTRPHLEKYFRTTKAASQKRAVDIGEALASLGVNPAGAAYVGDHPGDCTAAGQARVPLFAVTTGAHTASDFPEGAVVLASVADLPARLLRAR
jgi:phosphoglycolate phosphatase-like HAD superfamily hydrolase